MIADRHGNLGCGGGGVQHWMLTCADSVRSAFPRTPFEAKSGSSLAAYRSYSAFVRESFASRIASGETAKVNPRPSLQSPDRG